MQHLTREEILEIGIPLPTEALATWAAGQLESARSAGLRLRCRGVRDTFLNELQGLIESIRRCRATLGSERIPAAAVAARAVVDDAVAYLQEAGLAARIEFGSTPYIYAKFRTGIRTGPLLSNLAAELESTVAQLREHAGRLEGVGITGAFLQRGALLLREVGEAAAGLQRAITAMPPLVAEWCHQKGLLYDLTRKLVRIGRLEFLREPGRAAAFNYRGIRREGAPATRVEAAGSPSRRGVSAASP